MTAKSSDPTLDTVYTWWLELDDRKASGGRVSGAARARLRRISNPELVYLDPAMGALLTRLQAADPERWPIDGWSADRAPEAQLQWLATAMLVLVQIREDSGGASLGRRLADVYGGTDLRFRRLVTAQGHEALVRQLVSAVRLMGGSAPVRPLIQNIRALYTADAQRVRRQWALDYYTHRSAQQ